MIAPCCSCIRKPCQVFNKITLLLHLKDDIIKPMGRGEVVLAVMVDFSRVLLTTDHCTEVKKIQSLSFS